MVADAWTASFDPKKEFNNDTLREEFRRRNNEPVTYEAATFEVPDGYYSAEQLTEVRGSFDPNDKVGSVGGGPPWFYISGNELLRYVVYFENLLTATAPAQEVVITDQLDLSVLDVSTFAFGPVAFGNTRMDLPLGMDGEATIDLRPEANLLVRVTASIEQATGRVEWRLTSLDPATGSPPDDPLVGFLPPNMNPPEGAGSVVFTVSPRAGQPTGTQIANQAAIVFDSNAPILTRAWLNTINQPRCGPVPDSGCRHAGAGASSVKIRDQAGSSKDAFAWRWSKGDETNLVDFRDPLHGSNDYRVCIYDGSTHSQPLMEAEIPSGQSCGTARCWKATEKTGLKFGSKLGIPDGITSLTLKAGAAGKAKLAVAGKGRNVDLPSLPLTPPVTVQFLVNDGRLRQCWESVYGSPSRNDGTNFDAKGP
jgi:hypothetical protein